MTIDFKNIFSNKLTKYTGLLLILIFVLILFLLNMNYILNYFANKKYINVQLDKFNNINYNGYDTSKTNYYLPINNKSFEGFTDLETSMNDHDRNYKIIVDPKKKSVSVSFKEVSTNNNIIKGYLLILAKYNTSLQQVGHINAKITNEIHDYKNFIAKLQADGFITDNAKNKLNVNLSGDLSTLTASNIASMFLGDYDTGNSATKTKKLSNIIGIGNISQSDRQNAFFKLLELVYIDKFYHKALTVDNGYNTGIFSLITDFKTLFIADDNINNIYITDLETKTDNTAIINETNLLDQRKIIINANKKDVNTILNRLETLDIATPVLNFLNKFLNKYSNLSDDVNQYNKSGICNIDGECNYVFENLEDKDSAGNFYYYKLGIGLIYIDNSDNEKISDIYTYKYGNGGKLTYFKLDNTLEEQERLLRRLEEIEKNSILSQKEKNKPIQPMLDEEKINPMDAYMKMLEPHIGNYPDEFTLREQDVRDLSLADYLNKSLSRGTVNLNIDINDLIVTDDES